MVNLPASITFASLLVGQTGAEAGLSIFNIGNAPFILTSANVTGDFSIVSNQCSTPVAANGSCLIVLNFSPTGSGTRNGTLTLNDNLATPTQAIPLIGEGLTSAPLPGITSIPAIPQLSSGMGEAIVYGTDFLPNSTINWNGTSLQTSYEGPGVLVGALPVADLQQVGEASVTVSTPPPGGGTSGTAIATIYGRLANIAILNEVYDPATQLLYATVSSTSTNNANSLVAIDPVAMEVVATLLSGNQPDALAISGDDTLLYVGLDGSQSVAQLSLPSGAVNFTVKVPHGSDSFLAQNGMMASALAVVPGQPHTWLVGICYINVSPCGGGVAIFDDTVVRANQVNEAQLTANSLAFVNDPTVVYSTEFNQSPPNISSYSISPSGIALTATSPFLPGEGGAPLGSDGKLLYAANGQVIDPSTLSLKFTYPQGGSAFAIDRANQRLFFSGYDSMYYYSGLNLMAVDQSTQTTIGTINFPEYGYAADVQRFGTKGIVINNKYGGLLFVQSSLTTASAQLVFASPSSLIFPSQAVNTTSASQAVTLTNNTSTTVNISGIAVTGDYAQTTNCGSILAANASCNINVTFTPTATGDRPGNLTITDNTTAGTQSVALDGNGNSSLALAPAANGGNSVTVSAGSTATYNLNLAALGYSGTVTLTCSGAPANATCSINPASANLAAGQTLPFTVTVITNGQTAGLSPADNGMRLAGFSILAMGFLPLLFVAQRRAHRLGLLLTCFAALCLGAAGCGGGASSSATPVNHDTVPGTYSVNVTAAGNGASATEQLTLVVQ